MDGTGNRRGGSEHYIRRVQESIAVALWEQVVLIFPCQTSLFVDFLETGFVFLLHLSYIHRHFPNSFPVSIYRLVIFQTKFRVPICQVNFRSYPQSASTDRAIKVLAQSALVALSISTEFDAVILGK